MVFARDPCYTPQHVRHVFAVGQKKGPIMPPHTPVLGQRYVHFTDHLRRMFGCRVHKVSIDAGFTCPNRGKFGSLVTRRCLADLGARIFVRPMNQFAEGF